MSGRDDFVLNITDILLDAFEGFLCDGKISKAIVDI
jgi:hypothetical protein